jgi:hypothetical protein
VDTPASQPAPEPQPISELPPPAPPSYADRSTGLTIFGIIQIIMGALAALMIPLMLLGALFSRKTGTAMPAGMYVATICSYSFIAALLITLGIGSIRARRWAWALNLILSWMWLIFGVFATIAMIVFLPASFMAGMKQAAAAAPNPYPVPTGVMAVILTFIIVFFSIFGVMLPIAFLLFYRRADVAQTCKQRDPVERWTDRCPLPVLAVSLLLGWGAIYFLLMAVTTPMFPFFGKYLTGWPGRAGCVAFFAVETYLALSFYKLRVTAWWIAIGAVVLRLVSIIVTLRHADPLEIYSKLGWSQAQAQQIGAQPAFRNGMRMGVWSTVIFSAIFLGYMIWIKRYFVAKTDPPAVGQVATYQTP